MSFQAQGLLCQYLSEDMSGIDLGSLDLPQIEKDLVKIKISHASLNFPDWLMSQGKYQRKPELPFFLGMEGSGIIESVGPDVKELQTGDEVMFGGWGHGAMANYIVLPASKITKKPSALNMAEAAAFATVYTTAYVSLIRRGEMKPEDVVLIHGSSGGVGMAAVQLAKMFGNTVIATGTSDEKLEIVKSWGADHVLNTLKDGTTAFREEVKDLTDGKGADVIYDPVGGDVFDESIRCINWNGRLLIVGFTSGRLPSLPVNIALIKGFSVIGVRAGEYGIRDPEKGAETKKIIHELAETGNLKPHICKEFNLTDAKDALEYLSERKLVGKVVIKNNL